MNQVIEALLWSIGITILSQALSIGFMWLLGLPPRRLTTEIEDKQNPAVGAMFFIISLITALYVSAVSGDGYDPAGSTAETFAWIFGGALLAVVISLISVRVAYQLMDPIEGESLYAYYRRELIDEQNASLAFFLGGLLVAPFLATLQQIL